MFNADPKHLARIAAGLERVLIFDPQPFAAKTAAEVLRQIGARHVACAEQTDRALQLIGRYDPCLICTEYNVGLFRGVDLVASLRRSNLACRQAPVLMITGEATVESIKAARDAGAHEFLRKPFNARDLFRRVENVTLHPRPWIEAQMYVGPDRRRFNAGEFRGPRKRRADRPEPAAFMDLDLSA